MKYNDEYYHPDLIRNKIDTLTKHIPADKELRFMEFCGGHTHVFFNTGLINLLPHNIKLVHGPGCPICVLPSERIATLISALENQEDVELCIFADLLKVPGKNKDSLAKAKARGLKVRLVYSPLDAVKHAQKNPNLKIIFFAVGFETTTPTTALSIMKAHELGLNNFFVYCNHVKTAPAIEYILDNEKNLQKPLDGIIGPGHVATVLGKDFFSHYSKKYKKPIVVTGFSPADLLDSLISLSQQQSSIENHLQYSRAVPDEGNPHALSMMARVFSDREEFEWRGLGFIPRSALKINQDFSQFDAEQHFDLGLKKSIDHPNCLCGKVLLGAHNPTDCKLFAKACLPESPLGPCMVSSEGACSAYFRHYQTLN